MKLILKLMSIIFCLKYASALKGVYDTDELTLKYTDNGNSTDFIITSKSGVTTNVYYAFGLSNDDAMVNLKNE